VEAGGGAVRKLELPGSATSVRVARGKEERLVYLGESLTTPHEVFSCTPDGRDVRRLTNTNAARLASVKMGVPEEVWYTGAGGARVHAWLHPPVDRQEGVQVPLVVLVHGGPQGSWENRWSYRWNPQVWAAAGYAVLAPDPRGSIGYGQDFCDAIRNDWGGKCYEDIMLGVEHVVSNHSYIDGTRVAAAGGSFGGYMTFWMAGQTDRFRCLVSHAGLFDLESFYATTEEQWFPEWDLGGVPWEMPEAYEKWSPNRFVDRWKTPMLVIHGARDYRVPEAQGFAAYTTMQRRGVPSQLLHYPDEHHWIQKSRNSILWYDTVIAWLDRWCKQATARPGQP
jgi:dipeptidyl aminopeptidase/acylaminoacyl peptidase